MYNELMMQQVYISVLKARTHTHTQTHKHTNTQTHKHTNTQTHIYIIWRHHEFLR